MSTDSIRKILLLTETGKQLTSSGVDEKPRKEAPVRNDLSGLFVLLPAKPGLTEAGATVGCKVAFICPPPFEARIFYSSQTKG